MEYWIKKEFNSHPWPTSGNGIIRIYWYLVTWYPPKSSVLGYMYQGTSTCCDGRRSRSVTLPFTDIRVEERRQKGSRASSGDRSLRGLWKGLRLSSWRWLCVLSRSSVSTSWHALSSNWQCIIITIKIVHTSHQGCQVSSFPALLGYCWTYTAKNICK